MVESGLHTSIQFMDGKGMPNLKHLWQMVSHCESDGVPIRTVALCNPGQLTTVL